MNNLQVVVPDTIRRIVFKEKIGTFMREREIIVSMGYISRTGAKVLISQVWRRGERRDGRLISGKTFSTRVVSP